MRRGCVGFAVHLRLWQYTCGCDLQHAPKACSRMCVLVPLCVTWRLVGEVDCTMRVHGRRQCLVVFCYELQLVPAVLADKGRLTCSQLSH